jgi:hypothetical protein
LGLNRRDKIGGTRDLLTVVGGGRRAKKNINHNKQNKKKKGVCLTCGKALLGYLPPRKMASAMMLLMPDEA